MGKERKMRENEGKTWEKRTKGNKRERKDREKDKE